MPALLAAGNIPALAADWPCRFVVYTREQDIPRITVAAAFDRLKSIVPVEFRTIDEELRVDKYSAMSKIHDRVLAAAVQEHAAIVWLVPDAIWSDGTLRTVSAAAAAGKRAVMQPALRVVKETALPVLQGLQSAGGFHARDLVAIALEHMHPYYRSCFWDASHFIKDPALTFWRVGDEGVLARAFHLHPLMLFPERLPTSSFITFDDELPLSVCPDYDDFHVIENSDEGFHIDLTERDWCTFIPLRSRPPSTLFMAWWAINGANLHHRRFFSHAVRIHTGAMSAEWKRIERETARLALNIRLIVALWGYLRLPLELLFGYRRAAILRGRYALPKMRAGTNRWSRAFYLTQRQAFLFAYGWVYGYRSACRRLEVVPFLTRLHGIFWAWVYAVDRKVAAVRSVFKTAKKKTKGAIRRGSSRAVKQLTRQVSLMKSRIKHGKKLLRRHYPAPAARRRASRDTVHRVDPT